MTRKTAVDLYALLPALHRERDAEEGYPLKALLDVIARQVDLVKRDVDGLWDDFFIESCAEWVIPYIGDLVGNNPLHPVAQRGRVDVAKTVHYRRRKGTRPMLEDLARDVTGWGARVVPFFETLAWTQNLNHLRRTPTPNVSTRDPPALDRVGTANLRNRDALDRVGGPFDPTSHTVDVRPVGTRDGWHNVKNVGFFLWRLRSYPLEGVTPRPARDHDDGFHFSPLGNPQPLFTRAGAGSAPAGGDLVGETDVPAPIRPLAFARNPGAYYGEGKSLAIYRGPRAHPDALVPLSSIVPKSLAEWKRPPKGKVWVDVCRGRFAFAKDETPPEGVTVSYCYGFSSDVGGGPYDREAHLSDPDEETWFVVVSKAEPEAASGPWCPTIQQALATWDPSERSKLVIEIRDNAVYGQNLDMTLPEGTSVEIRAGDGFRPILRPGVNVDITGEPRTGFTLQGVALERGALVLRGDLVAARVADCTIVPGRQILEDGTPLYAAAYSLRSDEVTTARDIEIERSILGRLRVPADLHALRLFHSIVDAPVDRKGRPDRPVSLAANREGTRPGPATTLAGVTLLGHVNVRELTLASDVIFAGGVEAERRQEGCVRFSYVPPGSPTPRRYRCQPDLALQALREATAAPGRSAEDQRRVRSRLRPVFESLRCGDPAYAQLSRVIAEEIRTGAEDGAEMGAFMHLKQPQREANLRLRLEEYLPFGLEPGLIYVT